MKNIPLWQDVNLKRFPKLNEDINVDILIIGGGITGVSTFYNLRNDKRKVVLVEKNRIGLGVTSRSSAKITFLQENIYSKLKNNFNEDIAKLYYESQKEAISLIKNICNLENIDCDLEEVASYVYTKKDNEITKLEDEASLLESFGEKIKVVNKLPNNLKVKYGFFCKNTYVFHPLKFINGLVNSSLNNNHEIYENTKIIKIEKEDNHYKCYTTNNTIRCKYIVLALHYPYFLLPFFMPLKCHLEKSYILANKTSDIKKFSAINISNDILSIRYHKDYYLTIGSSHNLAIKHDFKKNFLDLANYSNNIKSEYMWSNHDVMTLDNLPYIGKINSNMLIATGFNTWGMTNGVLSGKILTDLLNNKDNKYKKIFNPKRALNKESLINYPINLVTNAYSFINSKINKNKAWYQKNPYFTKINGKSVAIYKDSTGKEYIVYSKCPHLKCTLMFNEVEKTWDCSCHGSRFSLDGKSIIGPSNFDITFK